MGRIRHTLVKRQAEELFGQADFGKDFNKNKELLKKMNVISSKTIRNRIAGYMVRIAGKKKF